MEENALTDMIKRGVHKTIMITYEQWLDPTCNIKVSSPPCKIKMFSPLIQLMTHGGRFSMKFLFLAVCLIDRAFNL